MNLLALLVQAGLLVWSLNIYAQARRQVGRPPWLLAVVGLGVLVSVANFVFCLVYLGDVA